MTEKTGEEEAVEWIVGVDWIGNAELVVALESCMGGGGGGR